MLLPAATGEHNYHLCFHPNANCSMCHKNAAIEPTVNCQRVVNVTLTTICTVSAKFPLFCTFRKNGEGGADCPLDFPHHRLFLQLFQEYLEPLLRYIFPPACPVYLGTCSCWDMHATPPWGGVQWALKQVLEPPQLPLLGMKEQWLYFKLLSSNWTSYLL